MYLLFLILSLHSYAQDRLNLGEVVLVQGSVFINSGEIRFVQPKPGEFVRVNRLGQYDGQKPTDGFQYQFAHTDVYRNSQTPQKLAVKQAVLEGDILETTQEGLVKILMQDKSVIDIGPSSIIQFQAQQLLLFQGTFRLVSSNQKLRTTHTVVHAKTAEFIIQTKNYDFKIHPDYSNTMITTIHGRVIVDLMRLNRQGLTYTQPFVVNPAMYLTTEGRTGISEKISFKALSLNDLHERLKKLGPLVDVFATHAALHPPASALPGTESLLQNWRSFTDSMKPKKRKSLWVKETILDLTPIFQ